MHSRGQLGISPQTVSQDSQQTQVNKEKQELRKLRADALPREYYSTSTNTNSKHKELTEPRGATTEDSHPVWLLY